MLKSPALPDPDAESALTVEETLELVIRQRSPAAHYWLLGRAITRRDGSEGEKAHLPRLVETWAQDKAKDLILANIHRCPYLPKLPPNPGLAEPKYRLVLVQGLVEYTREAWKKLTAADAEWNRLNDAVNADRERWPEVSAIGKDGIPDSLRAWSEYDSLLQDAAGYLELYALQLHAETRLVDWARDEARHVYGPTKFDEIKAVFDSYFKAPKFRERLLSTCMNFPERRPSHV